MDDLVTYVADGLLIFASMGAALFCLILSRRLTKLSQIDSGLGGAIAVLSAQVDDMSKALAETKTGSEGSAQKLAALNREARQLSQELELMLSACHDLDQAASRKEPVNPERPLRNPEPEIERDTVPVFLSSKSRLAGVR